MMDLESAKDWLEFVAMAAGLAALVGLHKPALSAVEKARQFGRRLAVAVDELNPNGGGSVRDRIVTMDEGLAILRKMQSFSQQALFQTDSDGHFTWASHSLVTRLGIDSEDIRGDGWLSLVDESERTAVAADFADAVARRRPFSSSFPRCGLAGSEVLKVLAKPVLSGDGRLIAYVGTFEFSYLTHDGLRWRHD